MTSATDFSPIIPPVRLDSATPRAVSSKEEGPSFADLLETETTATESGEDLVSAYTGPPGAQPAPPPATPAVNSSEALLAGLTLDAPATQAIDAATTTDAPSVNVTAPLIASAETAAPGKADDETAGDATPTTDGSVSTPPTSPILAALTAPAPATPITSRQTAAPTTAPTPDAAPLSAPGAERAAAPVESAAAPEAKPAAAADAPKAQSAIAKTATHSAEAAPDIKTDAAPSSNTSTPADTLATPRNTAADTTRTVQTNPALQNAPSTTIQVYQRMIDRIDGRAQRFEVRLDPVELGRVDVRIEVGADKKVPAVLAAHDSAALTDLMRGQRSLERALADAGIDLADGGIKFELSNDPGRNAHSNQGNGDADSNASAANVWRGFSATNVAVDAQTAEATRSWRSSSRLDLVA